MSAGIVRFKAPEGTVGGIKIGNRFYEVDENGCIDVRAEEAPALQGWAEVQVEESRQATVEEE